MRDWPRTHGREPLSEQQQRIWSAFGAWADQVYFPSLVGLVVEELRVDYARMRLPYRPELRQPHGLVHGGAIATLIDTVVVPAIGSGYDGYRPFSTVDMQIRYLGAVRDEDIVAEGWITQRGRSVVFCDAECVTDEGRTVATGTLTYKVGSPRPIPAT